MKQIIAFRCDFCKKVTVRKDRAKLHESGCFKNPESKSCITCEFLSDRLWLNAEERIASEYEMKIFAFEIEGTYKDSISPCGPDDDSSENRDLLPKYWYLNNSTGERYCNSFQRILHPLKTRCERHKLKI